MACASRWLSSIKCGFRGMNLAGFVFELCQLQESDFSGAILERAQLVQANFGGANLSGARLDEANCARAMFIEANAEGASLRHLPRTGALRRRERLAGRLLGGPAP